MNTVEKILKGLCLSHKLNQQSSHVLIPTKPHTKSSNMNNNWKKKKKNPLITLTSCLIPTTPYMSKPSHTNPSFKISTFEDSIFSKLLRKTKFAKLCYQGLNQLLVKCRLDKKKHKKQGKREKSFESLRSEKALRFRSGQRYVQGQKQWLRGGSA